MRSLPTATTVALALALAPAFAANAFAQDSDTNKPARPGSSTSGPSLSSRAAGGAASLIFTNIPGFPESLVPGLGGVAFDPGTGTADFDRVYGSPNGNYILTAFADLATTEDELVIVNGVVVQQEGMPGPWTGGTENAGTMDTKCDVNDSGDFTFATNTDGATNDDYIVTNVGGVWGASAREGDPIASLPGNTYDDLLDTPLLLADGSSGFAADGVDGTVATTEDDLLILGSTLLLQEGVTVPAGQVGAEFIENFDLSDFYASEDGAHWLVQGDLTGATTDDDVVIVDGVVALQENAIILGSGFTNPIDLNGIVGVYMDSIGNWYARGNNDASETDWVVKNGTVVASVGQPAFTGSGEIWDDSIFGDCFFLNVGNGNGDYIIGGVTDNADLLRNGLLVLNGTTEVCREGDPVDLDGNGMFDDDAFIDTFGNDDGHLSDAGRFYMVVTIRDGAQVRRGQAFMSIDLGPNSIGSNYCMAVPNTSGGIAVISATGSTSVASNNVTLSATSLPPNQFGIFVTSMTQGFVPTAAGTSNGNLCLGGAIGRYNLIQASGGGGSYSLTIDLTAVPQGGGSVAVTAGQTWNFQTWFRDTVGLGSNFSDGLEILFL